MLQVSYPSIDESGCRACNVEHQATARDVMQRTAATTAAASKLGSGGLDHCLCGLVSVPYGRWLARTSVLRLGVPALGSRLLAQAAVELAGGSLAWACDSLDRFCNVDF